MCDKYVYCVQLLVSVCMIMCLPQQWGDLLGILYNTQATCYPYFKVRARLLCTADGGCCEGHGNLEESL